MTRSRSRIWRKRERMTMLRHALIAGFALTLTLALSAQTTTQRAQVTLTADLLGANENPAVDTANTGSFTINMDFDVAADDDGTLENIGDAVQEGFDDFLGFFGVDDDDAIGANTGRLSVEREDITKVTVSVRGDFDRGNASGTQSITGFHIHDGGPSENGPVVVNFGVSQVTAQSGATRINRTVMLTSDMNIDTALEIAKNPGSFYLNLHTTDNPSGEIRAQLSRSAQDQTRSLQRDIDRLTRMMMQLTMTLSTVQGDLQDLNSQERLNQMNRIDQNVAAIGRRNGLNTNSKQVAGAAR